MPNTSFGISISIFCLTFTWQPKRQYSFCCFLVKYGFSVVRISPPPDNTRHLHIEQVPPPPHADGRNIFLLDKVVRMLDPASTSIVSCPLITIFTSPDDISFAFANKIRPTSKRVNIRNTVMLARIVVISKARNVMIDEILYLYSHKTHKCNSHESSDNESYSQSP